MKHELLKRFLEYVVADPRFEADLIANPSAALQEIGMLRYLDFLRPVYDKKWGEEAKNNGGHPFFARYERYQKEFRDYRLKALCNSSSIADYRFRRWRDRQMRRVETLFHQVHADILLHTASAYELTKGCSGRCPFCCLDAQPLEGVFEYNPASRKLWRDIQVAMKDSLGDIAAAGVPYWATDPFDNPDLELFMKDFHDIHGYWPPVTTVKHLEDPVRTRQYFSLASPFNPFCCRFSIISLPMFRKTLQTFSAQELKWTKLVLNNPESKLRYCESGRARRLRQAGGSALRKDKFYLEGSSACVSGFLVNLVDRRIQLISTCRASNRWPLGYMIFAERQFENGADYQNAIRELIEFYMPLSPGPDTVLRFWPELTYQETDRGFQVHTQFVTRSFTGGSCIKTLGTLLQEGRYTPEQIQEKMKLHFVPAAVIGQYLQKVWDSGVLMEPAILAEDSIPDGMVESIPSSECVEKSIP